MGFELAWMPPQAPYMPVAVVGLLDLLLAEDYAATAAWQTDGQRTVLTIDAELGIEDAATIIAASERPDLSRIEWPAGRYGQALKPILKSSASPARTFAEMARAAPGLEAALLRAIVTDAALDNDGVPGRSRLLRGVKADLSSADADPKGVDPQSLAEELKNGPRFIGRESGLGLGLVPEIQTFGGTTGPDASTVGAYSPLLYLLLWRGIAALPPVGVRRGMRRVVGGPLVTAPDVLSWPRWRVPAGLAAVRSLLGWRELHEEEPNLQRLTARGVDAVYRARAVPLSTMVAVFRWGERVAG